VNKYKKFLEKANANPNLKSIEGLYRFIEANCIEISEDGDILGFKLVSDEYMDLFTHTIDNSIGETITMDRNLVDSNPDVTCSAGLHICSSSYLSYYGFYESTKDRVILCCVNPADVCAVPRDYKNAKLRCCEYTVIKDVTSFVKDMLK